MERRLSTKVETYVTEFKSDITSFVNENMNLLDPNVTNLIDLINNYDNLSIDKTDFTKRKRIKTEVPFYLRCTAKRANGEQCTRKKKDSICFCGTHEKNRPHGEIDTVNEPIDKLKKIEVQLQEINGILYYIDSYNNIYKTEDIMNNKINPNIIAKCEITETGYKIINK